MQWLNEPPHWAPTKQKLTLTTAPNTDFWCITHYGFIRHSGHFFYDTITGDFVAEVTIRGQYRDLYDQAGLMVRVDEHHWLKAGIEYIDGVQNLSAVVTHDHSDWSRMALPQDPDALQLRLERRGETVECFYRDENSTFQPFRLTYFRNAPALQVGMMAASPDGTGFEVTFEGYAVQPVASQNE
jgi:regulation of enolase protein 1 (concanavalin A-like superfamily)